MIALIKLCHAALTSTFVFMPTLLCKFWKLLDE
jgi:hypothetical protein